MAVNVLEGVELNDIKLGQSVEETMANIDENFDKIIEVIDDLDDLVPTNVNDLEGSNILVTTQSGKATDSAKLDGKSPSHYLNYSNLTNRPSTLPNPQALKISDGTNTISYTGAKEETITKASIGLSNVTNVQAIPIDQKGVANGVAELNSVGRVNDSEKLGGNSFTFYLNYNNLSNTPTSLPNPKSLIFTKGDGSQNVTYDGNSEVTITKATLGLENATNAATIPITEKGMAGGVATLGNDGKVPAGQLPSFVDDVLEYENRGAFPTKGETGKIYVNITDGKTYRWGGSSYVEISSSLALGTTSSTAFAGNRGLALENRTINGKRLVDGDIDLTLNEIKDGGGYVRVKSGGDVTITNGVITVQKVGGQTADEIGKVKDVKVNGVSKLDEEGVANISIDALRSGYANVTASASRTINNTLYYGFTVEKTDIEFEVYNSANQQILTQKVIDGDNLFVACSTKSGGTYTLRTILGSGVGGGGGGFVTTDMLNAIAVRLQPYTTRTTETFELERGEYEVAYTNPNNGKTIYKINITRTVYAPPRCTFTAATIIDKGVTGASDIGKISINSDRKSATITIIGGTPEVASPQVTVTYEHTTTISF